MTSDSGTPPDPYDLAAMRDLLRITFTDSELRRFCQDGAQFSFLHSHFGSKFSLDDLIDVILEQCDTRDLLPDLLAEVRAYQAAGPRLAPRVPFEARPLPAHFVSRPEVSNALQAHLLAEEATVPGTLVVSAVHGMGGIGKTTLVAELSHRPELQNRFQGGLLWATLGQAPQILPRLHDWIKSLGDHEFHPTTVDGASAHLRTLLYDKACLLVVDDAWQAAHVRPFLVGGEGCRVLITTRDATLARKIGARLYDLDVMTENQALALFEAKLGSLDGQRDLAADLAFELGYLPLALELAAAQVEAGFTWQELLAAFRQGLADLGMLELDEAEYRNESLRLSFRFSLDRLPDEDRAAFPWLGVLPEDVKLNAAMAATLWAQPPAAARRRLLRLRDKALLKPVGADLFRVHDLLHDEAQLRLVEQMPVKEAHAQFLGRYRAQIADGLWQNLPDDGYIHEHLAWHLEQAEQMAQLDVLLCEETSQGRNGWYEARERLGQTAGYMDDVARAWNLAERGQGRERTGHQCRYALITASLNSLAKNVPPGLLVALVEKGLWSPAQGLAYARQVPNSAQKVAALERLARYMSPALQGEVLEVTMAIVGKRARVDALIDLAPLLSPELQQRAIQEASRAAQSIPGDQAREAALDKVRSLLSPIQPVDLSPDLQQSTPGPELVPEGTGAEEEGDGDEIWLTPVPDSDWEEEWDPGELAAAPAGGTLDDDLEDHLDSTSWLAPSVPQVVLKDMLEAVQDLVTDEARIDVVADEARINAVANLARYAGEMEHPEALLAIIRELRYPAEQLWALTDLLPHLAPKSDAWPGVGRPEDAPDLTAEERPSPTAKALYDDALSLALDAFAVAEPGEIGEPFSILAPYLARSEQANRTLRLARQVSDPDTRQEILAEFVLQLAMAGQPLEVVGELLASLTPRLRSQVREEVTASSLLRSQIAEQLRWRDSLWDPASSTAHQTLLRAIVFCLAELGYPQEARQAVGWFPTQHAPQEAGYSLALQLAELGYPDEALATAFEVPEDVARSRLLLQLAPLLPESQRRRALFDVLERAQAEPTDEDLTPVERSLMGDGLEDVDWLKTGVDDAPLGFWNEGAAPGMPGWTQRWMPASKNLTRQLAESGYPEKALQAVRTYSDPYFTAKEYLALVPHLPEPYREQALQQVRETVPAVTDEEKQVELLVVMAGLLPPGQKEETLHQALTALGTIKSEYRRARVLGEIAPELPAEFLADALAIARAIRDVDHRMATLVGLAPYLPAGEAALGEALGLVDSITSEFRRTQALADLAPHLPEPLLRLALERANALGSRHWCHRALVALLPHLAALGHVDEALLQVGSITEGQCQADALAGLIPYLPEDLLPGALELAEAIDGETWRTQALHALESAQHVSGPAASGSAVSGPAAARPSASDLLADLDRIRLIEREFERAQALAELAPLLADLTPEQLLPDWQETLHLLAARPRRDLLADLRALQPVIVALGEATAVAEVYQAVEDVGLWWP